MYLSSVANLYYTYAHCRLNYAIINRSMLPNYKPAFIGELSFQTRFLPSGEYTR